MYNLISNFVAKLPSRQIFLANVLFWLTLTTYAAYYNYQMQLHYGHPAVFTDVWFKYLPWWGNWALLTPLVLASTKLIPYEKTRVGRFIAVNVIVSVALFLLYWLLTVIEVALMDHGAITFNILNEAFSKLLISPLHIDFLVYLSVFCSGYAINYYRSATQQSIENEQLAKQLVSIELQSLRAQLNPHFLFNTLNTIASLIRLNEKNKAVKALSELSQMLRKVLENQNSQLIPLTQEIKFIESYLTIQKMRFEEKLDTKLTVEGDLQDCLIPFMLLQPLVENAIQHGSQLESNRNVMTLNIQIDNGSLTVVLINKVPIKDEHQGFGIGLNNCRQRLDKIYQEDYSLTLNKLENGYFETRLSLPIGVYHD